MPAPARPAYLRNVAIIAHVDHGKTTLIDVLLRTSGAFRTGQQVAERAMDSNPLERERGITILAKVTSLNWQGARINIVDTPGHADFGGEVERILNMVDGAILLVDAAEGPMPQTKFVLSKALAIGLKPIVVINKIDKPDARPDFVLDAIFDLFAALDATDEQLDFPALYGSAKHGWMAQSPAAKTDSVGPLLDMVLDHVPAPAVDVGSFRMLATTLEADPFLGRILTGRIRSGAVSAGDKVKSLSRTGDIVETFRVSKVLAFRGLERQPIETGGAGDIVALAGMGETTVADTLCDPAITEPIGAQPIDRAVQIFDLALPVIQRRRRFGQRAVSHCEPGAQIGVRGAGLIEYDDHLIDRFGQRRDPGASLRDRGGIGVHPVRQAARLVARLAARLPGRLACRRFSRRVLLGRDRRPNAEHGQAHRHDGRPSRSGRGRSCHPDSHREENVTSNEPRQPTSIGAGGDRRGRIRRARGAGRASFGPATHERRPTWQK